MSDKPDIKQSQIAIPFLSVLTIIAVGFVLQVAQSVVLPLIIAWLLSYILGPAINALAKRKVPTALATIFTLTILFVVLYFLGVFLYGRVLAIAGEYPKYENILRTMIDDFTSRFEYGSELIRQMDLDCHSSTIFFWSSSSWSFFCWENRTSNTNCSKPCRKRKQIAWIRSSARLLHN